MCQCVGVSVCQCVSVCRCVGVCVPSKKEKSDRISPASFVRRRRRRTREGGGGGMGCCGMLWDALGGIL